MKKIQIFISTLIDRFPSSSNFYVAPENAMQLLPSFVIFVYKSLSMSYFSLIAYDCWKEDTNEKEKTTDNLLVRWEWQNKRSWLRSTEARKERKKHKKKQTWRSKAITFRCVISWCITESWKLTLQQKIQLKLDDKVDTNLFSLLLPKFIQSGRVFFSALGYRPQIIAIIRLYFWCALHTHTKLSRFISINVWKCVWMWRTMHNMCYWQKPNCHGHISQPIKLGIHKMIWCSQISNCEFN